MNHYLISRSCYSIIYATKNRSKSYLMASREEKGESGGGMDEKRFSPGKRTGPGLSVTDRAATLTLGLLLARGPDGSIQLHAAGECDSVVPRSSGLTLESTRAM